MEENLLEVEDLATYFYSNDAVVKAVDGISFSLKARDTLAIVGESGCGKTVSMLSILGLIRPPGRVTRGRVIFSGRDLLSLSKEEKRRLRGREISMIFQDPTNSLNPTMTIGDQLMEIMRWHGHGDRKARAHDAIELLRQVGIPSPEERIKDYPFQFSGGMRQRVMIAMAMACGPRLIIADEPTTALDVTVQAQIMDLIEEMKERLKTAIILVTHDLGVAARLCQRVHVMYAGKIVEKAPIHEFLEAPIHPYSQGLLSLLPSMNKRPTPIEGNPPDLISLPKGCRFHPRCKYKMEICQNQEPILREVSSGHSVACFKIR